MKGELFRYPQAEFCKKLQRCYVLSKTQSQVQSVLLKQRHGIPWHSNCFQFKHFNTVFKHSCYHLNRSTMFLLDVCFPLACTNKLNANSYWHFFLVGFVLFLLWLIFPLQVQFHLRFCATLAPLKKHRFTGRRTHLSVSGLFMQNTIFLPMKTWKLEYHSLSFTFPRMDLLPIYSPSVLVEVSFRRIISTRYSQCIIPKPQILHLWHTGISFLTCNLRSCWHFMVLQWCFMVEKRI